MTPSMNSERPFASKVSLFGKILFLCQNYPGRLLTIAIAVFSLILIISSPLHELFWDDALLARHLPAKLWDVPHFLSQRYWIVANHAIFRPVVVWTLALNQQIGSFLGQISPFFTPFMAYRVFNILLHAFACYIVYLFANRLTKNKTVALLATVLFSVQAYHTEAIGLTVNRSEILALIFGSLFVMQHQAGKHLWLTILYLLLAIGSKESAIVWICIALFLDIAARERSWKSSLFAYPLYIAICTAWFSWHRIITEDQGSEPFVGANPLLGSNLWERLPTIIHAQTRYLQNLIFPEAIVTNYHYPLIHAVAWSDSYTVIGVLIFPLTGILLLYRNNWRKPIGQSIICYVASQAPNANVLALVGPVIAERLAYPPSAFFSLFIAILLIDFFKNANHQNTPKTILAALVVGWVVIQGAYSAIRLSYWSTDKKLFTQSAISAPNSADALYRYAKALKSENQRSQEFIRAAEAAVNLFPSYPLAQQLLGQYLIETSTQKTDVCRGYQHLINAYLGDPIQSILPGIVSVVPGFRIRHPQTVTSELQECGIDMSVDEAKAIIETKNAAFGAIFISPKTDKELPCGIACKGAQAIKKGNYKEASLFFEAVVKTQPNWKYLHVLVFSAANAAREFNSSHDLFAGHPTLDIAWKQHCALHGYSLIDACRKHFKVGIDGVPWHASPLHRNEK